MSAAHARAAIQAFAAGNRGIIRAETVIRPLPGASQSVLFMCAGDAKYVAKGTRNQKGLVAEHVVARLGQLLEAPVGDIALVEVPAELRTSPPMSDMGPGLAHATRFIDGLTDRAALSNFDVAANRNRFARLCILYSLAGASDHQLFYTAADNLVFSLDHGHFFPGGPSWTSAGLLGALLPTVDGWFAAAALTNVELSDARDLLRQITDADIEQIIQGPPPEWPFSEDDRVALSTYIKSRRDALLTLLPEA